MSWGVTLESATGKRRGVRAGFTLIETLVAVSILTFAVAGPLMTASRATVAAQIARDRLTASYLAQEGVEYVRAMRDDAYLAEYATHNPDSAAAWDSFIAGGGANSIAGCRASACTLDAGSFRGVGPGLSLVPCSGSSCAPLYLANGLYTEQSGLVGAVQTPFTRTVQAFSVTAADERIVSVVSWNFHGHTYTISVSDHLTPWQ